MGRLPLMPVENLWTIKRTDGVHRSCFVLIVPKKRPAIYHWSGEARCQFLESKQPILEAPEVQEFFAVPERKTPCQMAVVVSPEVLFLITSVMPARNQSRPAPPVRVSAWLLS